MVNETNRERQKSVKYIRFKNSTRTSKCKLFSSIVPETPKNWTEWARRKIWGHFGFSNIHPVANYQSERGYFGDIENCPGKSLTMPKKLKVGTVWSIVLYVTVLYATLDWKNEQLL